jgi:Aminoglycoside-2''-adenylyltransferase
MLRRVAQERSERASGQLEAIASLDAALGSARIEYWLFGGWAVDFWVGRVTREHDDIDAAAWRCDYDAIKRALVDVGWRHTPVENEVVGTRYTWGNAEVEFTFVEARDDGAVVVPIPEREIVVTTEPFGEERRVLHDVGARTIPLDLLLSGKRMTRDKPDEAAKDLADVQALAAAVRRT